MEILKRKSFVEIFLIVAILFAIAIFVPILYNTYNENVKDELNSAITSSTPAEEDSNVTKVLDDVGETIGLLDLLFPLLLVGLITYVVISLVFFGSHPIFLVVGVIVLAVAIILGVVYSNVYQTIMASSQYASTDAEFNVIGLFMDYFPYIIFILFIIGIIAAFVIPRGIKGGEI